MESAREHLSDKGYLFVLYNTSEDSAGFERVPPTELFVKGTGELQIAYLGSLAKSGTSSSNEKVHLVHFQGPNEVKDSAKNALSGFGWEIVEHFLAFDGVPENSTVLALDEIILPVISSLKDEQFEAMRRLIQQKCLSQEVRK
jgi:hypothetical protein